jgi:DNA-binding MarR family transcriptional regulator
MYLTWLNTNRVKIMPSDGNRRSSTGPRDAGRAELDDGQLNLLRFSHIFASVVREILEVKFLEESCPHSLTLVQFHLLKVIALNGGYQVGELAGFLGVSPPAATKNIDKLERLGLIVRSPSKGDRRATLLTPSPKGRRLVQKYETLKADRLAPVLSEMGPKDLDRLARLLERFSLSVIKQEDSSGGLCLRCAAYCAEGCSVGQIRGGCPCQKVRMAHTE